MWNISYEKPTHGLFKDLSGQQFGRLTVVSFSYIKRNHKQSYPHWNCLCECGNETIVMSSNLLHGSIVSCGCYKKEKLTTHGLRNHPLYDRCEKILSRCYNQNHESFHNYGGREQSDPIYVQESWKNDIGLMIREIESEIGLPSFKRSQIDRIENNLGYESGNLRWVDSEGNNRNRRNTHNHARALITKKATPTYNAWRLLLKKHGDEVCTEWKPDGNCETNNGFKEFLQDMGEKPYLGYKKKTPLKRYDETKPWCRENCYWS